MLLTCVCCLLMLFLLFLFEDAPPVSAQHQNFAGVLDEAHALLEVSLGCLV